MISPAADTASNGCSKIPLCYHFWLLAVIWSDHLIWWFRNPPPPPLVVLWKFIHFGSQRIGLDQNLGRMLGQSKHQSPCFVTQPGPHAQSVQLLSSSQLPLAGGIILVITMIIRALISVIIMVMLVLLLLNISLVLMTSITNTMTINIVNNGDDNLSNPILERAFLKVGDKVEKWATFS